MARKTLHAEDLQWYLPAQCNCAVAMSLAQPMRDWLANLAELVCEQPASSALRSGRYTIPICYGRTKCKVPGTFFEALLEEYEPHETRGMHLQGFYPRADGVYAAFMPSEPLRRVQGVVQRLLGTYLHEPKVLEPLFVLLGSGVRAADLSVYAYEFGWSAPAGLVIGSVDDTAMTTPYVWRGRCGVEIDARYFEEAQ